jgi:hypothetical protein
MLYFAEGFTFRNFLADVFAIFVFIVWFWLLIIVIGDLFRRHDISGWIKAIWVIALIVFPYLGIFAYMITQSRGMAERSSQQAQQARDCAPSWCSKLRRCFAFGPFRLDLTRRTSHAAVFDLRGQAASKTPAAILQ